MGRPEGYSVMATKPRQVSLARRQRKAVASVGGVWGATRATCGQPASRSRSRPGTVAGPPKAPSQACLAGVGTLSVTLGPGAPVVISLMSSMKYAPLGVGEARG